MVRPPTKADIGVKLPKMYSTRKGVKGGMVEDRGLDTFTSGRKEERGEGKRLRGSIRRVNHKTGGTGRKGTKFNGRSR